MRRSILILPALAAALVLLSAAPLRADSLDYTYTSGGNVITFQLPASSPITPDAVTAFNFTINNVMFSENGGAPTSGTVDFWSSVSSGGFDVYTDGFNFFALTAGPVLYSGSLSAPTLLTGTFSLTDFAFSDTGVPGTLTVTRVTGVPEPSALLLLGVGAMALLGAAILKRSLA